MKDDDDKAQTHVALTKGTIVSHYRIIEKVGAAMRSPKESEQSLSQGGSSDG